MGYDIAYHALDKKDLEEKMVPYIFGERVKINDLAEKIARVRRNRFIANQFASELYKMASEKPPFLHRIISKLNPWHKFDPEIHIWGRPFLVLETDRDKVTQVVKQYYDASTDEQVSYIIKTQVNLIKANLFDDIEKKVKIDDGLSSHGVLKKNYEKKMEQLKKVFDCFVNKTPYIDANNQEFDPLTVISNPYYLLDVVGMGYSAWMDRGLNCPSSLFQRIGVEIPDYVKNPQILYQSIDNIYKLKKIGLMECNYSLGIVVLPENINEFLSFFEQHKGKIRSELLIEGFSKDNITVIFQKIEECLHYCSENKNIFVESTDIFSGMMGDIC